MTERGAARARCGTFLCKVRKDASGQAVPLFPPQGAPFWQQRDILLLFGGGSHMADFAWATAPLNDVRAPVCAAAGYVLVVLVLERLMRLRGRGFETKYLQAAHNAILCVLSLAMAVGTTVEVFRRIASSHTDGGALGPARWVFCEDPRTEVSRADAGRAIVALLASPASHDGRRAARCGTGATFTTSPSTTSCSTPCCSSSRGGRRRTSSCTRTTTPPCW